MMINDWLNDDNDDDEMLRQKHNFKTTPLEKGYL